MRWLIFTLLFLANTTTPLAQTVDQTVLNEIKRKAKASHSDALIILQNNDVVCRDFFGKEEKPVYIASAGKSLASLAIGKLLDDGQLDSLDQPVHTLFHQWKQGTKKQITIRMLLNHTSGLQNHPNASIELEPAPDYQIENIVDLALAAELSATPGSEIAYNNKAVALIGGIVEKVSGKRFDHFYVDAFYKPMDIANYSWVKDRAGSPTTHGAFILKASDLVKFGQLMLNRGTYNGKRIISKSWIEESFAQGQNFTPIWGLLWWRLPEYEKHIIDEHLWYSWEKANVNIAFMNKMAVLKNIVYESKQDFYKALQQVLGENWNTLLNEALPKGIRSSKRIYGKKIVAYYANGYRGNYLVIVPYKKIVAVRVADADGFDYTTDFFPEFIRLVSQL